MYSMMIDGITKKYNGSLVLNKVSFTIEECKVYGLLGKNGTGKTTLLKMIVKLIPLEGYNEKVKISGNNKKVSALIENPSCYMNLTVEDNLWMYSALYYKNKTTRESIIKEIVRDFRLEKMLKKKAKSLSLGMLQKLKLAMTFISNANVLILDEPFNGLDIESSMLLKDKIFEESKKHGKSIVITSHNTEQLEKICDSFAILEGSRLVAISKIELAKNSLEEIYCRVLSGGKR